MAANFIDVNFMNDNIVQWCFMGFYGHPNWRDRYLSWDDICNLHNKGDHPWVVLGDFNEILYPSEKEGGMARPLGMMRDLWIVDSTTWAIPVTFSLGGEAKYMIVLNWWSII